MNTIITLHNAAQGHSALAGIWQAVKPYLLAGHRLQVRVEQERRSTAQNARMWAMLNDVSQQVEWHGQKLSPGEWKDMFTAALKRQKVVPGLDGGFVVLGSSTSRMSKQEMSDLMELVASFGADRGITWAQ